VNALTCRVTLRITVAASLGGRVDSRAPLGVPKMFRGAIATQYLPSEAEVVNLTIRLRLSHAADRKGRYNPVFLESQIIFPPRPPQLAASELVGQSVGFIW
jgi:hypothetical protein